METIEQAKDVLQDLIEFYSEKVDGIGTMFDTTYQRLEDSKNKRARMRDDIKETLAKKESLRKRDFDGMTKEVFHGQEKKENGVRQRLADFIERQQKETSELKGALIRGDIARVRMARVNIERDIADIKHFLREFHEQQTQLTGRFFELLAKGDALKIKDLRALVSDLQA